MGVARDQCGGSDRVSQNRTARFVTCGACVSPHVFTPTSAVAHHWKVPGHALGDVEAEVDSFSAHLLRTTLDVFPQTFAIRLEVSPEPADWTLWPFVVHADRTAQRLDRCFCIDRLKLDQLRPGRYD